MPPEPPNKEELYRDFRPYVWTICANILNWHENILNRHEMIEDAVLDTFARAFANITQYDSRRPFKHWIARIARNCSIDLLRKEREIPVEEVVAEAEPELRPSDRLQRMQLRRCMQELSHEERGAIRIRHEPSTWPEVAEAMNLTEDQARQRVKTGLAKLRKCMETGSQKRD